MRRALSLAAALLACGGDDTPETLVPLTEPVATTTSASDSSSSSSSGEPVDASSSVESSGSEVATSSDDEGASTGSSGDDSSTGSTEPASSTGAAAVCGDGVVDGDEACDDGDDDDTNECTTACKPWLCGDGFLQPGKQETCDDGNKREGDGCNKNCQVELECGKTFTTDWCLQAGTKQQYTRCGYVLDAGHTCGDPEIKYGTNEGGIPYMNGDSPDPSLMDVYCQQLGFSAWSGDVILALRDCSAPKGLVFFFQGKDEPGPHFVESGFNDGFWHGPGHSLNENDAQEDLCASSAMVHEITCI